MNDFLMELASKTGINPEQAKKAVGALLAAIKQHIPAEQFTRLSESVPGADDMMAAADAEHSSSGGLLSAVAGMASKIFGGGDAMAAVVNKLGHLGLSPEQIKNFLPQVIAFLKSKLPADVATKLGDLLPAEEVPAS